MAVFNGHRTYATGTSQKLRTRQMICSVVACTRYGLHESCGLLFGSNVTVSEPIRFDRLNLKAQIVTASKGRNATVIMANTLTRDILPMAPNDFLFVLANSNAAKYAGDSK